MTVAMVMAVRMERLVAMDPEGNVGRSGDDVEVKLEVKAGMEEEARRKEGERIEMVVIRVIMGMMLMMGRGT